jgi:hypothetical protein
MEYHIKNKPAKISKVLVKYFSLSHMMPGTMLYPRFPLIITNASCHIADVKIGR